MLKVKDLETDLSDGILLCILYEIISCKDLHNINYNPKTKIHKIENVEKVLKGMAGDGIYLVSVGAAGNI